MRGGNPLCVALDAPTPEANEDLAGALGPHVGLLKVGLTAFASGGPDLVLRVAEQAPVFLDLKLHDIPAQVAGAVTSAVGLNAEFITVHALGGAAMLEAASDAAAQDIKVLAVTLLTSMDERAVAGIGLSGRIPETVLRLARLATGAGADGLVCSPHEVALLRGELGSRSEGGPWLVVPGVRAGGAETHDQKRTLPAREALDAGADVLVVGRPVTQAVDPARAAAALVASLRKASL